MEITGLMLCRVERDTRGGVVGRRAAVVADFCAEARTLTVMGTART